MATLTQTITEELLAAARDPGAVDAVLRQHARSKGPLYLALVQATSTLAARLSALAQEEKAFQQRRAEAQRQAEQEEQEKTQRLQALREELAGIEAAVADRHGELDRLGRQVDQHRALVDRAERLAGLGFTTDHLERLHGLLAELAASQGASYQDAAARFFSLVGQYGQVASLELETKRAGVLAEKARADADRWLAEAGAAEARCQVRKTSIDATERLLAQGVKERDLPQWARIVDRAGLQPEDLAGALEQVGSLEALVQEREKRKAALQSELAQLERQVKTFQAEREGLHRAVQALRDEVLAAVHSARQKALAEVQGAGQALGATLQAMDARVQEFGKLREQVGDLRAEATLARALRRDEPDLWRKVSTPGALMLLEALLTWSEVHSFDPELLPPAALQRTIFLSPWTRLHFTDLLVWASVGLAAEGPRALAKPTSTRG